MHAALGLDSPPPELPRPRTWPHVEGGRGDRSDQARRGKSARAFVPRSRHGPWEPGTARADPVRLLMDQASTWVPELVPVRNRRMTASPFAFFRGSVAIMAADLARTPTTGITVQLCGDAQLSNFGGYVSPDRQLVFDINDFDETLPGPWEWDVKRLMSSLAIAGRDRGFDDRERAAVVRSAAAAYREAMAEFAELGVLELWHSRLTAADVRQRWAHAGDKKARRAFERQVARAMAGGRVRVRPELRRRVEERPGAVDAPVVVPTSAAFGQEGPLGFEHVAEKLLSAYRASLSAGRRHLLEEFRYADAVRKAVRVGSAGTQEWAVLMLGIVDDEPLALQLKQANRSVLEPYAGRSRHDNQGQRVAVGQELMQASSDIFLGWTRGADLDGVVRDFYVRQVWDWRLTVDSGRQDPSMMAVYGQVCAWILARAHARSGAPVAIASYLGRGEVFDVAMSEFAEAYADQNERDYARFLAAVRDQRVDVTLDADSWHDAGSSHGGA